MAECYRCGSSQHFIKDCDYEPPAKPTRNPLEPRYFPECGHRGHTREQQEKINARGALKVTAALRHDSAELERLAALTPSCLQSDEQWAADNYCG